MTGPPETTEESAADQPSCRSGPSGGSTEGGDETCTVPYFYHGAFQYQNHPQPEGATEAAGGGGVGGRQGRHN